MNLPSLVLVAACAISAASTAAAQDTEGWLFLGRHADGWKPASQSIARVGYPVKAGDRLVVLRDALVYGSVDCRILDAADFKPDGLAQPVLRLKADAQPVEVIGSILECPSAGRAKTVWANVRIPAARLLSAEK